MFFNFLIGGVFDSPPNTYRMHSAPYSESHFTENSFTSRKHYIYIKNSNEFYINGNRYINGDILTSIVV